MFVNRQAELRLLEQRYASAQAELFVLYGRRRVGKTELLARFCQDKNAVFFVADLNTEPVLRANFSAAANTVLFGPAAAGGVYSSWEEILGLLGRHALERRLVVVIDEFSYLAAAHPPILTTLQRMWDRELRHTRLMLILCGSYISVMEAMLLGYQAALYGRRTAQYLLEPLKFHDARLFFPHLDPVASVHAYAVLGGTPAYLRLLPADKPLPDFIGDDILTRGTFLYEEVRFLLQQELRDPRNYFAILEAIASGRTRLNEIKQATGLDGATAYLDTLQALRLVERAIPVTETQPHKSRRGVYRLCDPFVRFWFRFVHPNRTSLERGASQAILAEEVLPQLDTFTGPQFEAICEQFLWREGLAGRLPFLPKKIGGWWRANEEIDLLALGSQAALLVECKWSSRPVGMDILENLRRKLALVQSELAARDVFLGLCSRSGFTPDVLAVAKTTPELLLFDLERIVSSTD